MNKAITKILLDYKTKMKIKSIEGFYEQKIKKSMQLCPMKPLTKSILVGRCLPIGTNTCTPEMDCIQRNTCRPAFMLQALYFV